MKQNKVQMVETHLIKKISHKILSNFGKILNGNYLKTKTHPARKKHHNLPNHHYKRIY